MWPAARNRSAAQAADFLPGSLALASKSSAEVQNITFINPFHFTSPREVRRETWVARGANTLSEHAQRRNGELCRTVCPAFFGLLRQRAQQAITKTSAISLHFTV